MDLFADIKAVPLVDYRTPRYDTPDGLKPISDKRCAVCKKRTEISPDEIRGDYNPYVGFGHCELRPKAEFMNPRHCCEFFELKH